MSDPDAYSDKKASIAVVPNDGAQTPDELIKNVFSTLKADKSTDGDLLNILNEHVVTMNSDQLAAQNASKAIFDLASRRAEKESDVDNA